MHRIFGRQLNVLPGVNYAVKRAVDTVRATKVFRRLLAAAERCGGEAAIPLYQELCVGTLDDLGRERSELGPVARYGSFMADAIAVAYCARPLAALETSDVLRRLAVVEVSSGAAGQQDEDGSKRNARELG